MKIFRKQEGFTLVELLIAIMTGSIVTLAAVTVLLLGLRLNHSSSGTATRQNNARILLSVLETMAAEGDIKKIDHQFKDEDGTILPNYNDWAIGDGTKTLFFYSQADRIVYSGDPKTGTPLVEDILSSYVELDGNLLTVSITTEDETYLSSIYCRMIDVESAEGDTAHDGEDENSDEIIKDLTDKDDTNDNDNVEINPEEQTIEARTEFLKVLFSQYQLKDGRANPGVILEDGYSTGEHYTEWFIYGYNDRNPGWNKETPWCACYVSWCINEIENTWIATEDNPAHNNEYFHWYDNVDEFIKLYFLDDRYSSRWEFSQGNNGSYIPIPGDLIFFDWDSGLDPSHVGVVISVQGLDTPDVKTDDFVYTIEGNTGGRVAIRKYPIADPNIIGYGIMPWTHEPRQQQTPTE